MSDNSPSWDDTILPFQLDRSGIRGRFARLDDTLNGVLSQHDYPAEVEAAVSEAVVLTALMGQMMKLRWKLSLQVRGEGPIRLIATDYFAPDAEGQGARLRAWAAYDADALSEAPGPWFSKLGNGVFGLLIDQGPDMTPYQGITPLAGSSLADCAATYFAQSEQLPTVFAVTSGRADLEPGRGRWRAGGMMLQMMPSTGGTASAGGSGDDGLLAADDLVEGGEGEDWARAGILLETVDVLELVGPRASPPEVLYRLFHEEAPRVFEPQSVAFGCTCSADRVRQSLSIYSDRDIAHMTADDGTVTADCQFCGAHYVFDPMELGFEAEERNAAGRS